MANKSNQGKEWERMLERSFEAINPAVCTIVKTDPPVRYIKPIGGGRFEAVFLKPGQCDFEGGFTGHACCFDAKETKAHLFLKDRIKPVQWERMEATWLQGGMSGVFLRFVAQNADRDALYAVTFPQLERMFAKKKRFTGLELVASEEVAVLQYRPLHGGKLAVAGVHEFMQDLIIPRYKDKYEQRSCNSAGAVI